MSSRPDWSTYILKKQTQRKKGEKRKKEKRGKGRGQEKGGMAHGDAGAGGSVLVLLREYQAWGLIPRSPSPPPAIGEAGPAAVGPKSVLCSVLELEIHAAGSWEGKNVT